MHEKGLQRQKSVGLLFSSQEQTVFFVPRLKTGYQPVVNRLLCSPIGLHLISLVCVSWETFRSFCFSFFSMPWKVEGRFSPVRTVLSASRPAWPGPAVPSCPAPYRLARGMSGVWTRQVHVLMRTSSSIGPDPCSCFWMNIYVSSKVLREQGMVVAWANGSAGALSCPAMLRRPAMRRPYPTRPWYVRILDSTGTSASKQK